MVALNNIIARSKSLHVRYLVEKGLIALVLPKVHSLSTRIRLQALWIIGNMGTSEGVDGFKSDVLTAELVTNVVQVCNASNIPPSTIHVTIYFPTIRVTTQSDR